MANGEPTAQQHLAQAVADANKAPEPSLWVRIIQMVFAGFSFAAAIAVALILLLNGPPAPKAPEQTVKGNPNPTNPTNAPTSYRASHETAILVTSDEAEPTPNAGQGSGAPSSDDSGDETPDNQATDEDENDESESETSDFLANLNEQAPWAFAIVALLAGTFIATGKSLNFNGTKQS